MFILGHSNLDEPSGEIPFTFLPGLSFAYQTYFVQGGFGCFDLRLLRLSGEVRESFPEGVC